MPQSNVPPLTTAFDGQYLFGDPASYKQFYLMKTNPDGSAQVGSPLEIDEFLGFAPGTTVYGIEPSGGHIYGIKGQFLGSSSASVTNQYNFLQSFAGITATWYRVTGDIYPGQWWPEHNCYFNKSELVPNPSGIQTLGVNHYGLTYTMVMRQTGGS